MSRDPYSGLELDDRKCPDCGSFRIVGSNRETGETAWACVSMDCPPVRVAVAGVLSFDGDYVPEIDGKSITDMIHELEGKRVLVTVSVYGEPDHRE